MNSDITKIWLIANREFTIRTKKRVFLVSNFLAPFFLSTLVMVGYFLFNKSPNETQIVIAGKTYNQVKSTYDSIQNIHYLVSDLSVKNLKEQVRKGEIDGLIEFASQDTNFTDSVLFYMKGHPSFRLIKSLQAKVKSIQKNKIIEDKRIANRHKTVHLSLEVITLTNKGIGQSTNPLLISIISYSLSLFLFGLIFYYASQCMRGIIEERSNKVIEVLLCSVRPFELMMGKVLGIATVGMVQIIILYLSSAMYLIFFTYALSYEPQSPEIAHMTSELMKNIGWINSANLIKLALVIAFYFVFGYLLYSAIFLAVGSMVDSEADTQQFIIPVVTPLFISLVFLGRIILEPGGKIAIFLSIFPLTSSISMTGRLPFGVPGSQLLLSIVLLFFSFLLSVWLSSKVFRANVLYQGQKITSYKVLWQWSKKGIPPRRDG